MEWDQDEEGASPALHAGAGRMAKAEAEKQADEWSRALQESEREIQRGSHSSG